MMAAVKGRNKRYEVAIRKRLFSRGFRYRIDDRRLLGKPDIVLENLCKLVPQANGNNVPVETI
jgi:DNA mismatch endonuclease (patch repair protein)